MLLQSFQSSWSLRWITSFALCALFLVSVSVAGCGGDKKNNDTRYVALGDSIAYGPIAAQRSGYVYSFAGYLGSASGSAVDLDNFAVPLIKTSDLLSALRSDVPPGIRGAVRDARVLTISIGGNNVLGCANDDYTAIDTGCAEAALADFRRDWPQILAEIRSGVGANRNARLYAMTLYNPYREDDPNFAVADNYLQQINQVISDPATVAAYNYKVADVYSDFRGQLPGGTFKVCEWTRFCSEAAGDRDPHPSQSGHAEIARLHQIIYP